jgi:integrase
MDMSQLISGFLDRPNASTALHYREALKDYAHCRRRSVEAALTNLVQAGFSAANADIGRYAKSMIGQRDKLGKLTRGRGLSSSTINLRLTVLRSFVKKVRKSGAIDWELDVPSVNQEDTKDNRGPGIGVVRPMLAQAKKLPSPLGERAYAILRILSEVGSRRREIIGLDVDDFDPDKSTIQILGKGRTEKRAIPISRRCCEAIQDWLRVRPTPRSGHPLFTNLIPGRIERISGPAVYVIVRGLIDPIANPKGTRRNRFKRYGPHKLRHYAFTAAAESAQRIGISREGLQKFTGHKDARSMSRYIDAADDVAAKLAKANAEVLDSDL